MLRNTLAVTFLVLTLSATAWADVHIHGIVRDSSTRQVLSGATVRIQGTTTGAIAARNGVFHLHDVPLGRVTLLVSMVGYITRTIQVQPVADERLEILLIANVIRVRDVVVDAQRLAAGTATQQGVSLTQAEVDEHRGQTFADVLRQIPGVTVMQTGPSVAKPMIHGMTGTRLVLRNSGISQEGQQWGAEHAPEIDPFTTSRLGIVTGPSTVLYGANAIGGVISVEPKPLTHEAMWMGEVMANGFVNNLQGAASVVVERGKVVDDWPLAMRLQLSGRRAGDASTPQYTLSNTGFEERALAFDAELRLQDWTITANTSVYTTQLGIYRGAHLGNAADLERAIARGGPATTSAFTYDINNPKQEIAHVLMAVHAKGQLSERDDVHITYGWQQNTRREFDAHNTRIVGRGDDPAERERDSLQRLQLAIATPAMQLLLTTYSAEARWEHAFTQAWRMTSGVSGSRQINDRSGRVYLVPDYAAHAVGVFTLHTLMLGDVTLSAGVRYDTRWLQSDVTQRNTSTVQSQELQFRNVAASIGGSWNITNEWFMALNVGTGWRPPQVNELYSNDVHHGVALYEIGDSTLRSERSLAGDVTLRYAFKGVLIEASGYAHSFDGYILSLPDAANPTVTVRGTFPTYRFTQHDATITGADVHARIALDATWSLDLTAMMVRGTDVTQQAPLFMMPADRGRLGLHAHIPDVFGVHDAFVDAGFAGVRRQDRFVPGQDYVDPPPSYGLIDISTGGTVHFETFDVRFTVQCTNVLNTQYRDYLSRFRYVASDPGRDIILRVHIPLNH